ncbi:hypothetical protein [Fimbriiglobus ruber]|uniref:Uncharacterized protein n=1 Tax=Fimbriiglobus ruber TaxID=1908690 RepID=A0A225DFZ9_9BACT|nr:hypothetical protein [Fimbriiglobus ruber]OWK36089.1 hypothetical protein FRUB_08652 [Fimbriiglobus ruber]
MYRTTALASLLILAGVTVSGAEKAAAPATEVGRLIEQLGSPDFRKREAASAELSDIGPPALVALRAAAASADDSEVAHRAAALVETIGRRLDSDRALVPTLVELDFTDTPLAEVLAVLAARTGYAIEHAAVPQTRVTVKTGGKVPFWDAVEAVAAAAKLEATVTAANGPGLPPQFGAATPPRPGDRADARPEEFPAPVKPVPVPPRPAAVAPKGEPAEAGVQKSTAEQIAELTKSQAELIAELRRVQGKLQAAPTIEERTKLAQEQRTVAAKATAIGAEIQILRERQLADLQEDMQARQGAILQARRMGGIRGNRTYPLYSTAPLTTVVFRPKAPAPSAACRTGAVRVDAGRVPVDVLNTVPADTLAVAVQCAPEPKLRWLGAESVRVTRAVDDAGHTLSALVAPDSDPVNRFMAVRGGRIMVGGGLVVVQAGENGRRGPALDTATQILVRFKGSDGTAPKRLKEFSGVVRGVIRGGPTEVVAADGLDRAAPGTVDGIGGVNMKVVRTTPPKDEGDLYMVDVIVRYNPNDIQPASTMDETVYTQGGLRVIQRGGGGAVVNALTPADVTDDEWAPVVRGLTATDPNGKQLSLALSRFRRTFDGSGAVADQITVFVRGADKGRATPARVAFRASRTHTIDVPFQLNDAPVAAGGAASPVAANPPTPTILPAVIPGFVPPVPVPAPKP